MLRFIPVTIFVICALLLLFTAAAPSSAQSPVPVEEQPVVSPQVAADKTVPAMQAPADAEPVPAGKAADDTLCAPGNPESEASRVTQEPSAATPVQATGGLPGVPSFGTDNRDIDSSAYPPALSPRIMFGDRLTVATDMTPEEKAKIEHEMMDAFFKKWKVSITPYWYFFGAEVEATVGDRTTQSIISAGQVSSSFAGGFNARLDVNKAHWGGFIDVSDMQFSKQNSSRLAATTLDAESLINHYCLYYRFKGIPIFDIYGGVRSFTFNSNINLQPFPVIGRFNGHTVAHSTSWTDPIIGARMTAPLSKTFFIMVGGDTGSFASDHGSSAAYAIGSWALNKNITLNGGYMMLNFNIDQGSTFVNKTSVKARMTGPMLSIGINF
jgi:hypothetical protein